MGTQGAMIIPEKEFVLLTPKVGILEKCCEMQVIRIKTGVSCQTLERSIYHLVLMTLLNYCDSKNFFE